MPDLNETDTQRAVARLERLGVEHVRLLLATGGLPEGWFKALAMRWLSSQPTSAPPSEPAREPKHRSPR
jgi:hypothetical protein